MGHRLNGFSPTTGGACLSLLGATGAAAGIKRGTRVDDALLELDPRLDELELDDVDEDEDDVDPPSLAFASTAYACASGSSTPEFVEE